MEKVCHTSPSGINAEGESEPGGGVAVGRVLSWGRLGGVGGVRGGALHPFGVGGPWSIGVGVGLVGSG